MVTFHNTNSVFQLRYVKIIDGENLNWTKNTKYKSGTRTEEVRKWLKLQSEIIKIILAVVKKRVHFEKNKWDRNTDGESDAWVSRTGHFQSDLVSTAHTNNISLHYCSYHFPLFPYPLVEIARDPWKAVHVFPSFSFPYRSFGIVPSPWTAVLPWKRVQGGMERWEALEKYEYTHTCTALRLTQLIFTYHPFHIFFNQPLFVGCLGYLPCQRLPFGNGKKVIHSSLSILFLFLGGTFTSGFSSFLSFHSLSSFRSS